MLVLLILGLVGFYIWCAVKHYKIKARQIWIDYLLHRKKCKRCGTTFEILCEEKESRDNDIALIVVKSILWVPYYFFAVIFLVISKIWKKVWVSPFALAQLELENQAQLAREQEERNKNIQLLNRELEVL